MIRAACVALLTVASAHAATLVYSMNDVTNWAGSGPNQAVVIIDWQDGKLLPGDTAGQAVAWGVRWSGTTFTGYDALVAIDAADSRLQLNFITYSSTGTQPFLYGAYYDLNGVGGIGSNDPDDHFQDGDGGYNTNGFWGYLNGGSSGNSLPSFWNESGTGAKGRYLSNGSWDAWVFSTDVAYLTIPNPPNVAVVPEPSCALLAVTGLLCFFARPRRRP